MEPQAAPQPQTPPIPPTPKTNNSLIFIMSILLILTVGIAGLFYFQIQKLSRELSKYQTQATPTPTTAPDPTADWKTYKNTRLRFSIKYPSNWVTITDTDRGVGWSTFIADNEDRMLATKSFQVNIEYSNIFEIPWSNGKKVTITKDNLGYYAYAENTPATSVFQGRPAIKSLDSSPLYGAHTSLKILDGKRLFEVKVDTKDDKEITLHDQILSTFKFID